MAYMEYEEIFNELKEMTAWNDFAASLVTQYQRKGALSERQWDAAERMIQKVAATRKAKEACKREVDASKVEALFAVARGNGLKKPRFRAGSLMLSLAPDTGRNAGAIYVKSDGEYVGKVMNGQFMPVARCTPDVAETLAHVVRDPLDAAVQYGRETGNCACCGRLLTDPRSVELGIGPVCKDRWGL